jgi:hypothetical protein
MLVSVPSHKVTDLRDNFTVIRESDSLSDDMALKHRKHFVISSADTKKLADHGVHFHRFMTKNEAMRG